jgi:putative Mg2+ transporter-C (MgtC) family protein
VIDVATQLDLSVRLVVAAALGGVIGLEREIHGHPAGIRTHILVSLGAAAFTVMSAYGFGAAVGGGTGAGAFDPTRIAAQVVTGVGFLGAGAILKDGIVVRGLTTAASLWAVSAVGLSAGAGAYVLAVVATVIIVIALWPLHALASRLRVSPEHQAGHPR